MNDTTGSVDALAFPALGGSNGLVVEEAMVSGLPVNYVPRIEPDSDATRRLGQAAAAIANARGHERCGDDFEQFIERVLTMPGEG